MNSLIHFPSNRGRDWLCMKMTPHWNAVNHKQVKRLGIYFLMTIGCGTGNSPTIVVLCRKSITCFSSRPTPPLASSSTWGTRCLRSRMTVFRGSSLLTICSHASEGVNR